jgi:Bacterial SH3 domain
MIRKVAAVTALLLALGATPLYAQTSQFTVNVQSADVRKAPSVASPVLGQAPRGMVLEITRDLGAWVKVAWPDAPDGIGYVHQGMGTRSRPTTLDERVAAAVASLPPAEPAAAPEQPIDVQRSPNAVPFSPRTVYVAPPTHFVGLGGRLSGTTDDMTAGGFGVTTRVWSRSRFGIQADVSRSRRTSTTAPGRVTTVQFAPSAVYSLTDHVGDNLWLRPYIGTGAAFNHATLKEDPLGTAPGVTDNAWQLRAFGGAEFTLPAIARFALSADLGYVFWRQESVAGFDPGRVAFSLSGHWYVK